MLFFIEINYIKMTLFVQHDLDTSFTNYLTFGALKNYFVLNEYTYTHVQ